MHSNSTHAGRPLYHIGLQMLMQRYNALNLDTLKTMKFLGKYLGLWYTHTQFSILFFLLNYKRFSLTLNTHTHTHILTAMVEEAYHPENCYHNATHAADVTQALHCLLKEPKVWNSLLARYLIINCLGGNSHLVVMVKSGIHQADIVFTMMHPGWIAKCRIQLTHDQYIIMLWECLVCCMRKW